MIGGRMAYMKDGGRLGLQRLYSLIPATMQARKDVKADFDAAMFEVLRVPVLLQRIAMLEDALRSAQDDLAESPIDLER